MPITDPVMKKKALTDCIEPALDFAFKALSKFWYEYIFVCIMNIISGQTAVTRIYSSGFAQIEKKRLELEKQKQNKPGHRGGLSASMVKSFENIDKIGGQITMEIDK